MWIDVYGLKKDKKEENKTMLERFRVFSAVGNFRPPNGVVLLLVVHRWV